MPRIKTIEPISRWELIERIYEECTCLHDECTGNDKCENCYDFCINYDELVDIIKNMPIIATMKVNQTGNNCTCIGHVDRLEL